MIKRRTQMVSVLVLFAISLFTGPAFGQAIAGAQTALEAVGGGAVRSRSPGIMVSVGVAQALSFADAARAGAVITETSRRTSRLTDLIVETLEDMFEQLNLLIIGFSAALHERAGEPLSLDDLLLSSKSTVATPDK